MKKLSSELAGLAYDIMVQYSDVSPDYYQREAFLYQYSVMEGITTPFLLLGRGEVINTFTCTSYKDMQFSGINEDRINSIFSKIASDPTCFKGLGIIQNGEI